MKFYITTIHNINKINCSKKRLYMAEMELRQNPQNSQAEISLDGNRNRSSIEKMERGGLNWLAFLEYKINCYCIFI